MIDPLVAPSRRFLMACGVRVAALKLDYVLPYRVGFLARGAEYDGTAQIARMVEALRDEHGLPCVDFKSGGDCRVYMWSFDEGRVLRVKIWYDEGTVDYGFYVELEDVNLRTRHAAAEAVPVIQKQGLDLNEAARKLGTVFKTVVTRKG